MAAVITSKTNARVKALRIAMHSSRRQNGGIVAIEGPNLIAEALRSGISIDSLYVREDAQHLLDAIAPADQTSSFVLSRECFQSAAATEQTQGIAALIRPGSATLPLSASGMLLVLAGLQDPGNAGTLVRSAEAFGANGVVTTPGTVDVWNQKALRASAGSIFRMPLYETSVVDLKAKGWHLIGAVARSGQQPGQMDMTQNAAIVIGNEGSGLDPTTLALLDSLVTIPCPGAVESLNAAVAGSLLLYEASKQRHPHGTL